MIDGQNFFDQPVKNNLVTWYHWKSCKDDYTGVCLLDNNYFKDYYKMIAIDLIKRQALDADPKAMQQINFTENLNWAEGTTVYWWTKFFWSAS